MRTYLDSKAMAKAMRERLADKGIDMPHSEALEIVARQFGLDSWNILSARIDAATGRARETKADAELQSEGATPIFRIFDVDKAREYYLGFLGMSVDWEHRFEPDTPIYMQVSRGDLKLHLSEHSGDATPGANAVVFCTGVAALHAEVSGKNYRYNRPGLQSQDWGMEMQVIDPFGNRLRFIERKDG
ncbi:glyoxalase superfamily protein [Hoeflea alexandrii]|uniref:VOC family protein n=1 Tax=Hoeflea alexandrii TaxID=288436 RepID=A0ABT1CUC3_9HYPH|nr:glyoxalase superfamily protein [Hoeflea alexandrii]MCO6409792.1 VOC family protein [Hoeflea alexandrii]MCY0152798.1 VOC family protein [Hoeflea alexandrii]